MIDNNCDILAITETWLSPGTRDQSTIASVCPPGYDFLHVPRTTGVGGGVGLLYRSSLSISNVTSQQKDSFEHLHVKLRHHNENVILIVLYRPPPNRRNGLSFDQFNSELSDLIDSIILEKDKLILAGDFNIHIDDTSNSDARLFTSTLESYGLDQHVVGPTHEKGHTLDLLISRSDDNLLRDISIDSALSISDHFWINSDLNIAKPPLPTKDICYRKIKNIDANLLSQDIRESKLTDPNDFESAAELVLEYNSTLRHLLDQHAPEKKRTVTLHPQQPWYTPEIAEAKKQRRKAERKWRCTKLTVHREIFVEAKKTVKKLISDAKATYYSKKITDAEDTKSLFKIVDSLLSHQSSSNLPTSDSNLTLANDFSTFFTEKISKIRDHLNEMQQPQSEETVAPPECELRSFTPATEEEVKKVILSSKSTTCSQDPLPTPLLKNCLDALVPAITRIINLSLEHADMPYELKKALILPLLKKVCLDKEIVKNYRPIYNLQFISKIIERIVATRIRDHMDTNVLQEILQSAYKSLHSTETALLKVQDDVLKAIDNKKCVLLVLLDLSAAFDTVDHKILLKRLESRLGIKGSALEWIKSYLTNRTQSVNISGAESDPLELLFGVPQGSVLGPILFTIYTLPLGDILRKHGLSYHLYADDTQIYLSCDLQSVKIAKSKIETCIEEIRSWMAANFLQLNDSKTEVLLLGSKSSINKVGSVSLKIGNESIESCRSARNIGLIMDSTLNMQQHINSICKSAWFHLRNIGFIKQFLDDATCEKLIHAFVTSKLDFMNSLLFGVPKVHLDKLQRVQYLSLIHISEPTRR